MLASRIGISLRSLSLNQVTCANVRYSSRSSSAAPKPALVRVPEAQVSELNNGVRVASEDWNTEVCTIGVWMPGGSRAESDDTNGASQLLRHLAFSNSRSEISAHGASVGVSIQRDHAAQWVTCFSKDLPWAVQLLASSIRAPMQQQPEQQQLDRARRAALDELNAAESDLETVVLDYLHAAAYQGTSLSLSPLGQTEPLQTLNAMELQRIASSRCQPKQIVISAAGAVQHSELTELCRKHFGDLADASKAGTNPELLAILQPPPSRFTGSSLLDRDDHLPYAHVAIAVEGPGADNPDSLALMLASAYIGGWNKMQGGGNNIASKLARQAHDSFDGGIVSFRSFFDQYSDTSLWGMHFAANQQSVNYFTKDFQTDWMELSQDVRNFDLTRAKNALFTDLYTQLNSTEAACTQLGNHLRRYGRRIPMSELEERIVKITAADISAAAQKYIYDRCPAVAAVGPIEGMPDYNRIRGKMWFYRV